jgi:hypothetical protein
LYSETPQRQHVIKLQKLIVQAMYYNVTLRRVRVTIIVVEKIVSVKYYKSFSYLIYPV